MKLLGKIAFIIIFIMGTIAGGCNAQNSPEAFTPSDLDVAKALPTTSENAAKKARVIHWWAGILMNDGVDIKNAYNPTTADTIAEKLGTDPNGAITLIENTIKKLDKLDKHSRSADEIKIPSAKPEDSVTVSFPYYDTNIHITRLVDNEQKPLGEKEMQSVKIINNTLTLKVYDSPLIISPDITAINPSSNTKNNNVGVIYNSAKDFSHAQNLGFGILRLGSIYSAFWGIYRNGSPDGSIPSGDQYINYLDTLTTGINQAGFQILMVIEPLRDNQKRKPGDAPVKFDDKYSEEYKAFVQVVVKRLNGKVKYYALSNELDALMASDSYARALEATYSALKAACPTCELVTGGYISPKGLTYYSDVIKNLGGKKAFDHFDFKHFYGYYQEYKGFETEYDGIRNLLDNNGYGDVDIWMCETGSPSAKTGLPNTSDWGQAVDVVKRHITAFSIGIKKVLWTMIMDFSGYGDFDYVGLILNPANKRGEGPKPSYFTYGRLMNAMNGSDLENITKIDTGDKVSVYKLTKGNTPVYVLWRED